MKSAAGFRGLWVPFLIVAAASVFSLGFLFHYHNSQIRAAHDLTLTATQLLAEIEHVTGQTMQGILTGERRDFVKAAESSLRIINRIQRVDELSGVGAESSILMKNYLELFRQLGEALAYAQEQRVEDTITALTLVRERQAVLQRLVKVTVGQAEALRDRRERNLNFFLLLIAFFLLGVALFNGFVIIPAMVVRPMAAIARELEEQVREARNLAVKAEAANKSKSEFLANMSHELRTPLNGILGMNSLLMDSPLTQDQRQAVEVVHSSGEALLSLLNDILDFAKIEAGKLRLEQKVFSLVDLVDDCLAALSFKAETLGLKLSWRPAPGLPANLEGDPARLRQILFNLVGNAIKFTQQGSVIVRARVESQNEEGCLLYFSVEDTGIGIPADKASVLFQRFSQVDASINRRFGGTGLGLAIAKQLSELMGGEIGVKSEEGKGSLFWFTVRMRSVASEEKNGGPPIPPGQPILLCVANPEERDALRSLLEDLGGEVTAPDDFSDLTATVASFTAPVLVLVDYELLTGSSGALPSWLGALRNQPHCRAVLLAPRTWKNPFAGEEIWLERLSVPMRRREFLDLLQRKSSPKESSSDPTSRVAPEEKAPPRREVLLVEDNPTNQLVASHLLQNLGVHVHLASNGAEALQKQEELRCRLVFMDVQMPVMDGMETTQRLRQMEGASGIPRSIIIGMTAHAMEGDRERCLEAGMDDYLSKPITRQSLENCLSKWWPG